MITLQALMDRFRRASRDTFNAHFLPYAETERDHGVFSMVEEAMLQVMVLDFIRARLRGPLTGIGRPPSYRQIVGRPRRDGVAGSIQDGGLDQRVFDPRTRFAYIDVLDFEEPYGAHELDHVLGEIVEGPDSELIGRLVIMRWSDVEWIDPPELIQD